MEIAPPLTQPAPPAATRSATTLPPAGCVALVADSHLGGPGGDGKELVTQLAALPADCERLVLLGDIFHVWVGSRKYETPEIRRLLPALDTLRARGIRVDYVEGNRDFFLEGSPYERSLDAVVTELAFEAGGLRCLAVHGDGLNDSDRRYRFWRWVSKSAPSRFLIFSLPRAVARRAVASTERALARTNFKHRDRLPEEAIVAYGRRRLLEGYDRVYLGHFHEPRVWKLPEGEIHVLDAWFHSRRIEWAGATGAPAARDSLAADLDAAAPDTVKTARPL